MIMHESFFVVSASILPILFIGAAFEARYFTDKPLGGMWNTPVGDAVIRLAFIGLMVLGEVFSLGVLAGARETDAAIVAVGLAFLAAFFLVVSPMIRAQTDALEKENETATVIASLVTVVLVIGGSVYALTR
jgi:uncharacterized membrane protein